MHLQRALAHQQPELCDKANSGSAWLQQLVGLREAPYLEQHKLTRSAVQEKRACG